MGYRFDSIEMIDDATCIKARSHVGIMGERYICRIDPKIIFPGLFVALIYEPYPCFDSSDYDYENRKYWNYFFSDKPFTNDILNKIANLPHEGNCRYVHKDLPAWARPAVYWGGDSADDVFIAKSF